MPTQGVQQFYSPGNKIPRTVDDPGNLVLIIDDTAGNSANVNGQFNHPGFHGSPDTFAAQPMNNRGLNLVHMDGSDEWQAEAETRNQYPRFRTFTWWSGF